MIVLFVVLWSVAAVWAPQEFLPMVEGADRVVLVSCLWLAGLVLLTIFFSDEVRDP